MDLYDILTSDDVVNSIKENEEYLFNLIPEVKSMVNFDQRHPHHHLDLYNHTLYALSLSKNDFEIRIALLLHDIGKPLCYQEGIVRHYKNHAFISSILTFDILLRLNFGLEFIYKICKLVELHDISIKREEIDNDLEFILKRYEVQRCDALAHHPDKLEKRKQYLKDTKELILEKKKRL